MLLTQRSRIAMVANPAAGCQTFANNLTLRVDGVSTNGEGGEDLNI